MFRSFAAALTVATVATVAAAAVAAPAEDEAEKSVDSQDKIICKRFVGTGSLVKGRRTCKTKGEWERDRDNLRAQVGSGACGSSDSGQSC